MKKIGLLPLYLELYDKTCAFMRPKIENFRDTIVMQLEKCGLNILCAPICRLKEEFVSAVDKFEQEGVSAIITLHLAYSPSLESIDALISTNLPIIVLDTTESYAFDYSVSSQEILYNHGIHGVQDMCNLLKRHDKYYTIFAGHYERSNVLDNVAAYCRGVQIADDFRNSRVGLVGEPFPGMGDFYVPFTDLTAQFGINIISYDSEAGKDRIEKISEQEIIAEKEIDKIFFEWDPSLENESYRRSVKVCLALRKWIDEQRLTAVCVNFLETEGSNPGLPIMPFVECCKSMVRGIGYAGEGDVLTAALCGAMLQTFPETTFMEMFCPDWQGESIFISHMGEMNYRVSREKPVLTEMSFPYTSAENPTVAYATFKPGFAVVANLAPCAKGKYTLILALGEILDISHEKNNMTKSISGWFKPTKPLPDFLEAYSLAGGTHHSVMIYADCLAEMRAFAATMNFDCIIL